MLLFHNPRTYLSIGWRYFRPHFRIAQVWSRDPEKLCDVYSRSIYIAFIGVCWWSIHPMENKR